MQSDAATPRITLAQYGSPAVRSPWRLLRFVTLATNELLMIGAGRMRRT